MPPKLLPKRPKTIKTWGETFYGWIPTRESVTQAAVSKVVATAALAGVSLLVPWVGEFILIQMGIGLVASQAVTQYRQKEEPIYVVKGPTGTEYILTKDQYTEFCVLMAKAREEELAKQSPVIAADTADEDFIFVDVIEDRDQLLAALSLPPPIRVTPSEPQDILTELAAQQKIITNILEKQQKLSFT